MSAQKVEGLHKKSGSHSELVELPQWQPVEIPSEEEFKQRREAGVLLTLKERQEEALQVLEPGLSRLIADVVAKALRENA